MAKDRLSRVLAQLQKKFGDESAVVVGDGSNAAAVTEVIPTGIEAVDHYLCAVGGLVVGRMSEWSGMEGCLDGGTFIRYESRRGDGSRVNGKGGSIAQLYARFHAGTFDRARVLIGDIEFWAPSVNEHGRVVQNRITDVINSGVKECFTLVTRGGERITATADHEFYVGDGQYTPLGDLRCGGRVFVHLNTPHTNAQADRSNRRSYLFVKNHPIAGTKIVGGRYEYKRLARSRAVVEAVLNGLELHEYVARLNRGELDGLDFLPRDEHVHHVDEDNRNDDPSNLRVVLGTDHNREHAIEEHNNLRFVVTEDTIAEIIPAGPRRTYDVKMADPYRNVIADRIVVHNCGKTTLGYACIASVQRMGGVAHVLDAEHSFDSKRARAFGVDTSKLLLLQPRHAEMGIEQTKMILHSHDPADGPLLMVWDTIAAMIPEEEIAKDAEAKRRTGGHAALFSRELPKIVPLLAQHRAHLMALNQVRQNIGVMFGPDTVTPGGNAVKFYSSFRVSFYGGKAIKHTKTGRHTGKVVTLVGAKTRFSDPFRKVRLRLDYDGGFNNEWTTLEHAKTDGVIDVRGKGSKGAKAHAAALKKLGWPAATFVSTGAVSAKRNDEEE
jgi:recombination protein RecA